MNNEPGSRGEYDATCAHCGGQAYYKHSVGACKCPTCGGLTRTNGQPIGFSRCVGTIRSQAGQS